jgi:hypothetical protein
MVRGLQTSEVLKKSPLGQVVVLHGMVSPEGRLNEVEVLASTNASFEQAAVEHAERAHALQLGTERQPGTTPHSREIVLTAEFAPKFSSITQ